MGDAQVLREVLAPQKSRGMARLERHLGFE